MGGRGPVLEPRCALVAVAAAAAALVDPRLATVVLLLLVAGVGLDLLRAGSPAALVVSRPAVPPTRAGEAVEAPLVVTNAGRRRVRGALRDGWPPSTHPEPDRVPLDVPPGERRTLAATLRPDRRGRRTTDGVTVRSRGPLGLAARQRTSACPGELQVLPAFASRRHLPARLQRLRDLEGAARVRGPGSGTEVDALRPFAPGDEGRHVDWRATARAGEPVVRTYRPERDRRVLLLLDTGRTSAGRVGDATRLDEAMEAALLLGAVAAQAGDRVALLACDGVVRARVGFAAGGSVLPALVRALAPVQPVLADCDHRRAAVEALRLAGRRSLVVLLTSLDPVPFTAGWSPLLAGLRARHPLLVASVADPRVAQLAAGRGSAGAVYAAAAAESARLERAGLAARLSRLGIGVVDEPPDRFPPALADAYLARKAAGVI